MFGFFTACRPCKEKDREIEFLHGRLEKKRERIKDIGSCRVNTEEELRRCCREVKKLKEELATCQKMNESLIDESFKVGNKVTQLKDENETLRNRNKQLSGDYPYGVSPIITFGTLQKERDQLAADLAKNRNIVAWQGRQISEQYYRIENLLCENEQFTKEYEELQEAYNHLLAGYPDDMTPTDAKNINDANCTMADEIEQLKREYEVCLRLKIAFKKQVDELATQLDRLKGTLLQSPSEICLTFHIQNCQHCNRLDCCDNTSPAKESLANAAQEIKQLKVRLDNCGYYAAQASIESRRSTIGRFLRNIITEAENPLQKRKAA